jgi:predicted DNA-binding transcriptional regulator YafY
MKQNLKQFLTSLAILPALPGRLLALSFKTRFSQPKQLSNPSELSRSGPWLADWRRVHWVPVLNSVHPTAKWLIAAALRGEDVTFRYRGGSTPGAERRVSPGLVFQARGCGLLYVSGYCHLRQRERVFRVDRAELLVEQDEIIRLLIS